MRVLSGDTDGAHTVSADTSVVRPSESVATLTSSWPDLSGPTATMKLPSGEKVGSSAERKVPVTSRVAELATESVYGAPVWGLTDSSSMKSSDSELAMPTI